jgi:hypothetical protein
MAGTRKAPARRAPAAKKEIRLYPPPAQDFDPFAATKRDLMRHGLPLRPDPHKEPGMAALWERQAARYRSFEHLQPQPDMTTANKKGLPAKIPAGTAPSFPFGPDPIESCGYQLFSSSGNFTALFVTWTVPDLKFNPGQFDAINHFHTFVGLGFLDVHVEMTVDPAQNVTAQLWAQGVGNVNLPVRPGDVISGTLCLQTNGKAAYFFANETTAQTISFAIDTGFPPAVTINAGVTRTGDTSQPPSSTRWPASASSTSTRSVPSARVAAGRSPRGRRSPWSTRTARPSRAQSGSTTSRSRRCSQRRSDRQARPRTCLVTQRRGRLDGLGRRFWCGTLRLWRLPGRRSAALAASEGHPKVTGRAAGKERVRRCALSPQNRNKNQSD